MLIEFFSLIRFLIAVDDKLTLNFSPLETNVVFVNVTP